MGQQGEREIPANPAKVSKRTYLRLTNREDPVLASRSGDSFAVLPFDGAFEPVQEVGTIFRGDEGFRVRFPQLEGANCGEIFFGGLDEVGPAAY